MASIGACGSLKGFDMTTVGATTAASDMSSKFKLGHLETSLY